MYNENVLKWCGSYYDDEYEDLIVDEDRDIILYDDTEEWYNNIDDSEADV